MIAARCSPTGWRSAVQLDDRETATVLAALRFYQRCLLGGPSTFASYAESDIATDGWTVNPLNQLEIDDLAERLNQ